MNTITTTTEITIDTKPVRNKNAKAVYCISTGNVYASTVDAGIGEKCCQGCVSAVCRGKFKQTNGKQFCYVKDMPARVLDISNATKELHKDASVYRAQEAERKAKEAHQKAMHDLEEKMTKRKQEILEMQEKLAKEQQMYEAMEKEFNV